MVYNKNGKYIAVRRRAPHHYMRSPPEAMPLPNRGVLSATPCSCLLFPASSSPDSSSIALCLGSRYIPLATLFYSYALSSIRGSPGPTVSPDAVVVAKSENWAPGASQGDASPIRSVYRCQPYTGPFPHATFRFVAQHLNHCATAVPIIRLNIRNKRC